LQACHHAITGFFYSKNYFEQDGQRYSYIIDPATGNPVRHELASVTVVAETTAVADALATALLVLGPQRGRQLAEQQSLAAFFILVGESGFTELSTPAFEPYLVY
jgi:thiamine biosynthesis lipoprotein